MEIINFFKQKKVQNVIIIILFLSILIFSSWVRVQNLPNLIDYTTGKNIPLALDPFYFLRLAETILEQGSLPEVDVMRVSSIQTGFTYEILPNVVVFIYKIVRTFNPETTLQYIHVIYPTIFFALGLITFFFLILILTNKWVALLGSFFLASLVVIASPMSQRLHQRFLYSPQAAYQREQLKCLILHEVTQISLPWFPVTHPQF